ncbi:NADH dehydrogenase [Intrasporangium chromatireducens Q5-1]|uniref:NADH-quinone oxidoreductase subunit J n=1 Tax=Intrasporangium chromatireducens Q5-1 TaxID=584657 RepID=W9GLH1_9MICO|nr:NADH-quinone oxidoreductase subunit J [Intrasporangium chromatireducens]EWT05957.1 NADH dehydrogenase [Intrasporangium chromatireducens Q5-1]
MTSTAEAVAFWILGPLAVLGALGLIFARKAVHAALGMALTMVTLGVFYLIEKADFLGVIQIFVYTGAVMMIFLFVIMLVGVDSSDSLLETIKGQRWWSFIFVIGLAGLLIFTLGQVTFDAKTVQAGMDRLVANNNATGNVTGIAEKIFGQYVWAFEVTSALLITAALGAMVLAHRERIVPKRTQAEWAARRVKENQDVAGLPAPGVYARHNAVDTPALLPDGRPAAKSVSRVLVARDQVARTDGYRDVERYIEREIEEGRQK